MPKLKDTTINVALKIPKSQHCSWIGFGDTTLEPTRKYSYHEKNLIHILHAIHHWITMGRKSINKVLFLC